MKTTQKDELLGTVMEDDSLLTKENVPDLEVLRNIENEKAVISAFCSKCSSYHELAFNEAEKVFLVLAQPLSFDGKYLIFHSCSFCKGEDKTVVLKSF